MITPPDSASVARFTSDFEKALGRPILPAEPVALAVSGGADSMAMLVLAVAAFPAQVVAATMDHGLRAASADEAAMVAACCAQLGVPHSVLYPDCPINRRNVQAGARAARYAALGRWAAGVGAGMIATAHHADDQAETFLMRAARGSGVAGLAGIRMRQRDEVLLGGGDSSGGAMARSIDVVRPLLGWRASALRAIVIAGGICFVDDPSNADGRYDRTAFRALLAATPLLDPLHLARSAAHAAEADAALRAIERLMWDQRNVVPAHVVNPDKQTWLDLAGLPREVKRRLARSAIAVVRGVNGIVSPEFSDSANIESLLDAAESGKKATQAGVLLVVKGSIWRFSAAPPRQSH